jgi:hypothetical protein
MTGRDAAQITAGADAFVGCADAVSGSVEHSRNSPAGYRAGSS